MRITGVLIAVVPLAFGLVRAGSTGSDFRYLWVALVSSIAAGVMVVLARRAGNQEAGVAARSAPAVFAAAGAAGIAAFGFGAGSAPAVLMVAFGFAVCSGVGLTLAAPPRGG